MKHWLTKTANLFGFTKGERRGIIALLGILVTLTIGIQIVHYCYSKPCNPELSEDLAEHASPSNWSSGNRGYSRGNDSSSGHVETGRSSTTLTNRAPSSSPSSSSSSHNSPPPTNYRAPRERERFTVQANRCDTLDLQQIRGIGPAFARRIVKYREQLGGFVRVEQLMEVWGMDVERYMQVKDAFVIDKRSVRKLNINTATIRDLQNHPYLDYYQAKAIVQTRDRQGLYESVEAILTLALIDQETFNLLRDYLEL